MKVEEGLLNISRKVNTLVSISVPVNVNCLLKQSFAVATSIVPS